MSDFPNFDISPAVRMEQERKDRAMGIPEDAPEEFKLALRNMGPLTRKRTLKKLSRDKLTEGRYNALLATFLRPSGVAGELNEDAGEPGRASEPSSS